MAAAVEFSVSTKPLPSDSKDISDSNNELAVYRAAAAIVISRLLGIDVSVKINKIAISNQGQIERAWNGNYELRVDDQSSYPLSSIATDTDFFDPDHPDLWYLPICLAIEAAEQYYLGQRNYELMADAVYKKYRRYKDGHVFYFNEDPAIYGEEYVNYEYHGYDEFDGYGKDNGYDRAIRLEIFMMIRLIIKYWNRIDITTSKLRKYQTS
jgi:hypothetical protein